MLIIKIYYIKSNSVKKTKQATSIVEIMVIMLILVSWIVWMYKVYSKSENLSLSTKNKITAIQIAREWIEAVKNIRDTNWVLFSADTENCWNVHNYNIDCVWNSTTTNDIPWNEIAKIVRDTNNRWILDWGWSNDKYFWLGSHISDYKIKIDSNWFYTQSWWTLLKPTFTRYIEFEYLDDWRVPNNFTKTPPTPSNEQKVKVYSVVQWADSSSSKPHKVEFTTVLTNWKR